MFSFGFSFGCGSTFNYGAGLNLSSLLSVYSYKSFFNYYSHDNHHGRDSDDCPDSSSSPSSVLLGTTNTDGSGSSVNLTVENASLSLLGDGSVTQDGASMTHTTNDDYSETYVAVSSWNQDGYKEVKISNADDALTINGVVDVDINNTSSSGVDIEISSAKRGQIDTACGDDNIDITVFSNNDHWVNDFVIDTGAGNDSLVMTDSQNSSFTSLEIDMGRGNDSVDVAGLSLPSSSSVTREIDGGDGFDILALSADSKVDFANFESIQGVGEVELSLSGELLAANDGVRGLVFSDVDLTFTEDVCSISIDSLSWCENSYLDSLGLGADDYIAVQVTSTNGYYELYTNDTDGFC